MQHFKGKLTGFISFALVLVLIIGVYTSVPKLSASAAELPLGTKETGSASQAPLYDKLHLKELGLGEKVYELALKGLENLKTQGHVSKNILSICDFTQSSGNKRLYIIDLGAETLLFNTLVAHGKNTGDEFARYFSNQPSSLQSSLGFYVTGEAYEGKHGLGLRLNGLEPGFNDKAAERAIVMHGAGYVCDAFIDQFGRLGRSFGCPAVPFEMHQQIINTIKDGTCLFIYYPDKKYMALSKLIR